MKYALVQNNTPVELSGSFVANSIQYPANVLTLWNPTDLAAIGVYPIVEPSPPPYGKTTAASNLTYSNGVVTRTVILADIPLDSLKAAKKADVDGYYAMMMSNGYPHNFGTTQAPNWQVLQIGTLQDQLNWTMLLAGCQMAIAAGFGSAPIQPPMRTASNNNMSVSVTDAVGIIQAMRDYGSFLMKRAWDLKDQIAAAPDAGTLQAIDITAGWTP